MANGSDTTSKNGVDTLAALARETTRKIQWDRILADTARQWKWRENARAFSVYTKKEPTKYGVLSIGVVKGTLNELAALVTAHSQAEYEQKMHALHGDEFRHGQFYSTANPELPEQDDEEKGNGKNTVLSVRSATFARSGWLKREEQWLYLDATVYDKENKTLEQLLTSLKPHEAFNTKKSSLRRGTPHQAHGVICGYRMEQIVIPPQEPEEEANSDPEAQARKPQVASVRVYFYGELCSSPSPSQSNGFTSRGAARAENTTSKATKHRLHKLATNCDRFSVLVRRRRLGIQVLVDQRCVVRSRIPNCFNCDTTQLIIAKLCRVCGQTICKHCSAKYERDVYRRDGSVRVEKVRVCDPCLARVDRADYSNVDHACRVRFGAVVPDDKNVVTESAADLQSLLRSALLEAPSPARKASVMSVIRCVLDQEQAVAPSPMEEEIGLLTPLSVEKQYVDALDCLQVPVTAHDAVELSSSHDGRPFTLNPRKTAAHEPMPFVVPANEAKRLQLIQETGVLSHDGSWEELNLICEIAARELQVEMMCIVIVGENDQHVVACNLPQYENMKLGRGDSMCQHAVMEGKPLIVQHPEADIRFSRVATITGLGMRYYCGFPLLVGDDNDTVVGILCCTDPATRAITESQFAALQKLSQTASKIVRLEAERRHTRRQR